MWFSVFLTLGVIYAIGAIPLFTKSSKDPIGQQIQAAKEVDETLDITQQRKKNLGYLICEDPDGPPKIKLESGSEFIEISPVGADYTQVFLKALDFEKLDTDASQQNRKKISFICEGINGFDKFEVALVLLDINDNAPIFQRGNNGSYSVIIDEYLDQAEIPKLIYDEKSPNPIYVTDADGVNNNKITAVCVKMTLDSNVVLPCDGYFSVEEISVGNGEYYFRIYALRTDYSAERSYTLEILANNTPAADPDDVIRISTSQNVAINIRDLQNLPPSINKDKTIFSMFENLQPDKQLAGFLEAYDLDVGDPHPIRFELVPPRLTEETSNEAYDAKYFRLGNVFEDGTLYKVPILLNASVDREQVLDRTKTVYLGVLAKEYDPLDRPDREKGTAYETISIQIIDVNDQGPVFNNDTYTVTTTELSEESANPENFNPISNNVQIEVVDSDSADFNKFNVSIISGNENNDFKLDKYDGNELQLFNLYAKEKILDFEKLPNTYVLKLRAVDVQNQNFVSTATVTVSLVDANDHDPEFANDTYNIQIKESQEPGIIGSVTATDQDSGSFGIISGYDIIGGDKTLFRIDNNGNIYLEDFLDYEVQEIHYLTVAAYDSGEGNNRRVGSIQVVIQLLNENDIGPEFDRVYSARLYEQSKDLIPNIIVVARSRDASNPTIQYGISRVEPSTIPLSTFSINSNTGQLFVNQEIDYKQTVGGTTPGFVTVFVEADTGNLASSVPISIEIIDLNNYPPIFVPAVPNDIYRVEISELAVAGFTVIDLNVTDEDGPDTDNGRVYFQVQSGANDDFLITGDSGIIKVSASANLDIEENQKSYEIVILAVDRGRPPFSATATVSITLLDANNKNPVFDNALYRFQMRADFEVDDFIGQVGATDLDSANQLVYSIDFSSVTFNRQSNNQNPIDASEIIKMNPSDGVISVAGRIERELYDRINMDVLVEDINIDPSQPRQFGSASVVIFILAAVDPSIYFTNGDWRKDNPVINLSFSESENINYQILSLRATDPSIPETIQDYRKVESSDVLDYFSLKGPYLSVKKPLDYEALPEGQKFVSVVVLAVSRDKLKTATATVIVTVTDLNDNAPEFEEKDEYVFTVSEGASRNFEVGKIKATDKDTASFGQVDYYFAGTQTEFDIYVDNENRGVIFVTGNGVLDYETNPIYNLVVIAEDNPGKEDTVNYITSVDVIIQLLDKNDQSPVFKEKVYNITVIGTKPVGDSVYDIIAEDGDAGVNGLVLYDILNSTNNGRVFFDIDTIEQTSDVLGEVTRVGRLFVKSSLESLPDRAMFELTIIAQDEGNPRTPPGLCKAIITVSKGVQDLKPKWDELLPARVKIEENQPGNTFVEKLTAYPADVTSKIIYSFVGAGDALRDYDKFTINRDTGEIRTKVPLDYESQIIFSLLVLATDSENDTLTNQYLLIVEVLDVDDNQPSFSDCLNKVYSIPEVANVDEERMAPLFVYRAEACDLDDAPLNLVEYSWFIDRNFCPDNTEVFELNKNNGQIETKVKLDRESESEYMLCIEASRPNVVNPERDLTSLNNSNKLLFLKVNVRDVNDIGPKFYEPSVKTIILQYPQTSISVAEAYDLDLPPNNGIRYSIDNIDFTIKGKTQNAPTAFTINANDGTITIGTNDYSDYIGGYFDITVRAEDYNGANVPYDHQLQRVYVTVRANRIRVIFNEPADEIVNKKANDMINELNELYEDSGMYYEIESISYHVVSNNADPSFDKTDVCLVVVENDNVLSAVSASKRLTDIQKIEGILDKYGAVDPGSCDPAVSMYPVGWESYWWVLVAFAIFIFVCCLILILLICVLYKQYRQYMDSRKTYLVPN